MNKICLNQNHGRLIEEPIFYNKWHKSTLVVKSMIYIYYIVNNIDKINMLVLKLDFPAAIRIF